MTKLHPSIVITSYPNGAKSVSVAGEPHPYDSHHIHPEIADTYATEVSGILWSIEVSERPAKPRPTRIWDESL